MQVNKAALQQRPEGTHNMSVAGIESPEEVAAAVVNLAQTDKRKELGASPAPLWDRSKDPEELPPYQREEAAKESNIIPETPMEQQYKIESSPQIPRLEDLVRSPQSGANREALKCGTEQGLAPVLRQAVRDAAGSIAEKENSPANCAASAVTAGKTHAAIMTVPGKSPMREAAATNTNGGKGVEQYGGVSSFEDMMSVST